MVGKPDPALIPPFVDGEALTIARNVGGRNVIMTVLATDPCVLSPHQLTLHGSLQHAGVSAYADERVARQRYAIDRLLAHLQKHCQDLDCPHRTAGEDDDV